MSVAVKTAVAVWLTSIKFQAQIAEKIDDDYDEHASMSAPPEFDANCSQLSQATVGGVHPLSDTSTKLECPPKTQTEEIEQPLVNMSINFMLNQDIKIILEEG